MNTLKLVFISLIIGLVLYGTWQWYDSQSKRPVISAEQQVVEKFQCYRCHEMTLSFDTKMVEESFNCRICHQNILHGELDEQYPARITTKWKKNIRHLVEIPSLKGLSKRMQRQWFIDYIQNPSTIRPHLLSMMPRLPVSTQEAILLADYFSLKESNTTQIQKKGNQRQGKHLFSEKACNSCHLFSINKPQPLRPYPDFHTPAITNTAKRNAPDLRHTRQRMSPQQISQWLQNPKLIKPDTLMPSIPLTDTEIADLVAYIVTSTLTTTKRKFIDFNKPSALTRPVRYKEVEQKVFKALCWHCHSDPKGNKGDGGAGNTGGFGYLGAGLDLGSYKAITNGSQQADGTYRSILQQDASGVSKLVRHLLARHNEMRGHTEQKIIGMPLALPPLTTEQIQLIVTWIEQGEQE